MSKFVKFKTVTDDLNFVGVDSIFMVTPNEIYYTYGNKIESMIIDEATYFDIVIQISAVSDGWINFRNYVDNKNEMSHLFVRENSIKGIVKNYELYVLKLEYNHLPAEIAVTALTESNAEGIINYFNFLSE